MNDHRARSGRRPTAVARALPRALARMLGAIVALAAGTLIAVPRVVAHGGELPPEPDVAGLLLGWSFDPLVWVPLVASAAAYLSAVRRVDRAHPTNPVPRDRPVFFLLGLAAIAVALQGGVERWDTTLFSIHMVQHLLLVVVAAPAIALGAPITLLLRVATPATRSRWILPVLRSRVVKVIGHPLVAWLLFAATMWASHFSPLFDAALESEPLHMLEHVLFLGTALLFWWPVVGRDPSPWRMGYPARLFYVFLQMPLNSFLAVLILFNERVLYPHYATTGRTWGPSPLDDQQLAGAIMWGLGDAAFLLAILLLIAAWMRDEEATTRRREAVEDARAARVAAGSGVAERGAAERGAGVVPADLGGAAAQAEGIGASR